MARIRSVKPDFFKDEDLCALPFWARLLYEGLWLYADREGRLENRPIKLKVEIFPYDKVDVSKGIDLLGQPKKFNPKHPPFILCYENNGDKYIQILNFHKHQTPHCTEKPSVIPAPQQKDFESTTGALQEHTGASQDGHYQESLQETMNHKQGFEDFWKAYPRKEAKTVAKKVWDRVTKTEKPEDIKLAAENYLKRVREEKTIKKFIKLPTTFLNEDRWKDYLPGAEAEADHLAAVSRADFKPRMA